MSVIGSNILAGASGNQGYFIQKSLRFRSSASAYLNRTPASATDRQKFTWSGWLKIGYQDTTNGNNLFCVGNSGSGTSFEFRFDPSNNSIKVVDQTSGTANLVLVTSSVYRDFSAYYHVILSVDTTQATSSNRVKLYVNGSQVTSFSTATYPSQNFNTLVNSTSEHLLGCMKINTTPARFFDGYMTEINFIDGQALTPSSFGEYSTQTGVWQPKKYSGTYGTNGFYLPFSNNSSTTTLGYDFSGNGNNWTTNNISLTSGSTYDSMVDVPTVGELASNYCVLNPLDQGGASSSSGANLQFNSTSSDVFAAMRGTFGVTSGKWYFEATPTTFGVGTPDKIVRIGVTNTSYNIDASGGDVVPSGGSAVWDSRDNGATSWLYLNGVSGNSYAYSFTVNDVVMVAFDADTGKIWFGKNGTWNTGSPSGGTGEAATLTSGYTYTPIADGSNSTVTQFNFGQRPFAYTPPTGFKALNTYNLPTPTIGATPSSRANKYFDILLYTGNNSTQTITGLNFQPTLVWGKARSSAIAHNLFDQVRGGDRQLDANDTAAEIDRAGDAVVFNSNGITLNAAYCNINNNAVTNVAWNWAGNGTGSSNTAGSITSTVSANTTSGFSIVTYTGNYASGATVGHGLGVAPKMVIIKSRSDAYNWIVYHQSLGNTKYLKLNGTDAAITDTAMWTSTSPTSTVITLGTNGNNNNSTNNYVAYCFAEVAGFSKFGSYTGNGSSDGTFVYTGFRPRYVMIKRTDTTSDWYVYDSARDTFNQMNLQLFPNLSQAENASGTGTLDFLSNGFKLRGTFTGMNASGGTYIYACFSENPYKYSLAR